jgi:hypothetical protein
MRDKSPEALRAAALEVGALQTLSHFSGDYRRGEGGEILGTAAIYSDFIRMMKEIGYTGYFGYELCHPLPVVNGQTVGIEYAEESAQLACQYMKGLIAQAYGEAKP